jgi:hypothetical protein
MGRKGKGKKRRKARMGRKGGGRGRRRLVEMGNGK